MKYFHQLTTEEYQKLRASGITYKELAEKHPQPKWCKYPGALEGTLGCWKLAGCDIKKQEDCKGCEYVK